MSTHVGPYFVGSAGAEALGEKLGVCLLDKKTKQSYLASRVIDFLPRERNKLAVDNSPIAVPTDNTRLITERKKPRVLQIAQATKSSNRNTAPIPLTSGQEECLGQSGRRLRRLGAWRINAQGPSIRDTARESLAIDSLLVQSCHIILPYHYLTCVRQVGLEPTASGFQTRPSTKLMLLPG